MILPPFPYFDTLIFCIWYFIYFFTELKTYQLSYFYLQTLHYRHCWSQEYAGRVSYELCNRPRSPGSLCGAKVWGSISHGDSEFFLWPTPVTRWKTSFSTCWYCFSRFGTFYWYRCFQFVVRRPDSCLKFWASVAEFWRNSVIIDILENKSMFSLTKYTVIYFPLRPT